MVRGWYEVGRAAVNELVVESQPTRARSDVARSKNLNRRMRTPYISLLLFVGNPRCFIGLITFLDHVKLCSLVPSLMQGQSKSERERDMEEPAG